MAVTGLSPLLQVFDMNEAIRFYCDGLGFQVVSSSPTIEAPEGRFFHWVLLRRGGAELMLNTAYDSGERPPKRDAARWGGHRDTGLFIGCDDVDEMYRELRAKGLDIERPSVARYGMKQLNVHDPDGFEICFQTPVAEPTPIR
jgi:glyoxylase I family protein